MRRRQTPILVVALVLAGCAATPGKEPLPRGSLGNVTEENSREAVLGLCEARAEVERDPAAAGDAFFDRAHDRLHVIAAAVEEVDRPSAARLLEAIASVEADVRQDAEPERTAADLDALLEATRASLERLGLAAPRCP